MKEQNIRPWGKYTIIEKTKIIEVKPNSKLSLQYHNHRDEFWQILSGSGKITIGEETFEAQEGNKFTIPKGVKHRVESYEKGLTFLEVATGEVDEGDIVRIEDEYGREKSKKTIVITSGYFDPLHIGHLECLQKSKELGDKLIVILNNDEQAKIKKGKPFMCQEERKKILEALPYVDEVFISIDTDSSVCKSIEEVAKTKGANIFTKGGDRFSYEIPEAKICQNLGIRIIDSLGEKIQSSSWLISKAKENENSKN